MKLTLSEQLYYSTVKLQSGNSNGTGFFLSIGEVPDKRDYIITNKHVIVDPNTIGFTFETNRGNIKLTLDKPEIIYHYDNSVDLCAINFISAPKKFQSQTGIILSYLTIPNSFIPTKEQIALLQGIEDVIMIGYPLGIQDEHNNKPIVRKGITASNLKLEYNGKQELLLDIAIFPGSSGSPIFIYNSGAYFEGGQFHLGKERCLLIGIASQSIDFLKDGEIKIKQIPSTLDNFQSQTAIPTNLGIAIKSSRILEMLS